MDECIISQDYNNGNGFKRICVNGKRYLSHRYEWIKHNGEIPENMLVCHSCHNSGCININHLYLSTKEDFYTHMTEYNKINPTKQYSPRTTSLSQEVIEDIINSTLPVRFLVKKHNIQRSRVYWVLNKYKLGKKVLDENNFTF